MIAQLQRLVEDVQYYLGQYQLDTTVIPRNENTVDIEIKDEGEDFCIGSCTDPGLTITWLGEYTLNGEQHELVLVNGIVITAYGKSIVGWAIGSE